MKLPTVVKVYCGLLLIFATIVFSRPSHADEQLVPITRLDGSKSELTFEGAEDGSVKIEACREVRTADSDVCALVCTGHDAQGPGHIELPFRCIDSRGGK